MKYHFFIGIDRSDQTLDFCLLNSSGEFIETNKISSAPESLKPWVEKLLAQLPDGSSIALCIEQPCQGLTHFFRQFEALNLYLINPAVIKRFRESLSASRAKDDKRDAHALGRFVFERHSGLAPWTPLDEQTQRLDELTEKRRQLVDIRTSLTNRLTQALKDTYPQALELVGRYLYSPLACAFLSKWPTLLDLQKARPSTITQFYYTHRSRRPGVIEKRLVLIASAVPNCTDRATLETSTELIKALVKQLQTLTASIERFDKQISQATAAHQDSSLFTTLPGAGQALAPRLLSFFGSDRSTFANASEVQKLSGVAPLTKQSGKMHFVHRRYACNKFWRQTFVEWAAQTVTKSLWAKAYYNQQKEKGHRHQSILRSLAYKWQRILFRCWQQREQYNEDHYLKALQKSGSPLVKIIADIKKTEPKFCEQLPKKILVS